MENTNTGNISAEALTPQEDQIQFLTFQGAKFKEELTTAQAALGNQIKDSLDIMTAWRESITAQINAYNEAAAKDCIYPLFTTGDSLETIDEILTAWLDNCSGDYDDQIERSVEFSLESERGWGGSSEMTITAVVDSVDGDDLLRTIKNDILNAFKEGRDND